MHRTSDQNAPAERIRHLRAGIDHMDAELAALLERRALLAAEVQRLKPVGYFAGRDGERERALVERMAEHAPRLGAERLAAVMDAVITAGLCAAQEEKEEKQGQMLGEGTAYRKEAVRVRRRGR